jgi:cytoskeletal protein RodZ
MKSSNVLVSVIVIAAVLIFSYAVGLLIRQVRTGDRAAPPPAAGSETPAVAETPPGPGPARTKDTTPEERARIKEQRAKALEQMNSLTEEQQEKVRSQVRQQVGGRRDNAAPGGRSPQLRPAQELKTPSSSPANPVPEDVNSPTPQDENK